MTELATLHLAAAVPLAIQRIRERGGTTERDILWAQQKMQALRDGAGGHAIAYLDPVQTAHETALSRKLDEVSAAELARLKELEVQLVRAADRGDSVQVALLEAEMDAILLKPVQVAMVPVGEVAQQALFDEIGA